MPSTWFPKSSAQIATRSQLIKTCYGGKRSDGNRLGGGTGTRNPLSLFCWPWSMEGGEGSLVAWVTSWVTAVFSTSLFSVWRTQIVSDEKR